LRKPGECTAAWAAKTLGVNRVTIYRWAVGYGRTLDYVRRTVTGRIYLDKAEIMSLNVPYDPHA
jgi:hypothetical protein